MQPAAVVLELDLKRYRKLMQNTTSSDPSEVQQMVHKGDLKVT